MTDAQRQQPLEALEAQIGYRFKQRKWLERAFTHPSINLRDADAANYERLEFLGDRVLGLVVAEMLFDAFPNEDEGAMAQRHSALVCGKALTELSQALGLGAYIALDVSEERNHGREKKSTLANVAEALMGALFKDGGWDVAKDFVQKHWQPMLEAYDTPPKDPKSGLQEWAQARGYALPVYHELSRSGEAHLPLFCMEVVVQNRKGEVIHRAQAEATSKKKGQRMAAAALLEILAAEEALNS